MIRVRPEQHQRLRWWPWALTAAALVTWAVLATSVGPGGHRELTGPEWQRIAADPAAHVGEQIVVFGVVTQGGHVVRAAVDGLDRSDATAYGTAAELRGPGPLPAVGDTFLADVTVRGPADDGLALDVDHVLVLDRTG
ncbi:hypothetical protein GCM10009609_19050 [Pseudonocardia aurantiaca]